MLAGATVGGGYVFEAASTDNETATGVSAVIQYALAFATILLVFITARVANEARKGSQQTAHESLRQRLDARGPFATVYHTGTHAFLEKAGTNYVPHPGDVYTVGVESLDDYTVVVGVEFTVAVHGDAPAFGAVAFPTATALMDLKVEPLLLRGDLKPKITWYTTFAGQEILEIARRGSWDEQQHGPMIEAHVSITDPTRTVEDRYVFQTNWWPFDVTDDRIDVIRSDERIPFEGLIAPAHRSYDEKRAHKEPG